jgi:hypothetical protein
VWSDVNKANARLEEVVSKVKGSALSTKDTIYDMSLFKEKFTKRDMTKQYGTPITKSDVLAEDEEQGDYEEHSDVDLMKRTIDRHLSSARSTNIAIFLASLDPSQQYSKEALLELLGDARYEQPENMLRSFLKHTAYGGVGGVVFTKTGNEYRIREELVVCWRG